MLQCCTVNNGQVLQVRRKPLPLVCILRFLTKVWVLVSRWLDTDSDGIGNNADLDDDDDGQSDADETSCGSDPLDDQSMSTDTDADGIPDCVDTDDENDGTLDTDDDFPLDPSEDTDTDGDGLGDNVVDIVAG